jgi:hypothetical protein
MPKGVYRKKTKRGFMHFRDGKLISKASYERSKSSKKRSTRKGMIRKTSRRAYTKSNGRNRKMKKAIPHPSVTGMASGLAIASYLNAGRETTTNTGIAGMQQVTTMGEGVIKDVTDGELGKAFSTLSNNAVNMIASEGGRKTLVTAGVVALAGALTRSRFPNLKLGGSKLYFRV